MKYTEITFISFCSILERLKNSCSRYFISPFSSITDNFYSTGQLMPAVRRPHRGKKNIESSFSNIFYFFDQIFSSDIILHVLRILHLKPNSGACQNGSLLTDDRTLTPARITLNVPPQKLGGFWNCFLPQILFFVDLPSGRKVCGGEKKKENLTKGPITYV